MSGALIALFPKLSSHAQSDRLAATATIAQLVEGGDDDAYARKRLARGLGSRVDASRLGFSVALTEVLGAREGPRQAQAALELITVDGPGGGMAVKGTGADERDAYFAMLFGMHAILRSGVVWRTADGEEAMLVWTRVVDELLKLHNKKAWLRGPTAWVLAEALREVDNLAVTKGARWAVKGVAYALRSIGGEVGSIEEPASSSRIPLIWDRDTLALALTIADLKAQVSAPLAIEEISNDSLICTALGDIG